MNSEEEKLNRSRTAVCDILDWFTKVFNIFYLKGIRGNL